MKRPASRARRFAGVVAAIAPVALWCPQADAQEGPIVVGKREKPPVVSLYDWRGELELLWRYRAESRELSGAGRDELTEHYLEQTISAETKGHIYHPNLIELNLAGTIGISETFFDANGESGTTTGFVNDYDLSALILRKEVAPVTLYTRRTQDLVNRDFGPTLDYTIMTTGAIWDIRSKNLPTRLEIYHSNQTQTGIVDETGQSDSDFELSQNVFTWHSEARPRPGHVMNWDYTLSQVNESSGSTFDNDYWLNDANLSYSIDFGKNDRSNFLSSLSIYDQTGDFPNFRARWLEQLRLYHSDWFETRYAFSYDRQSVSFQDDSTIDQDRFRGATGFTHKLFKSLETRGNVGGEYITRSDDSGSTEYFGDLNFDYTKEVPFGDLRLFLATAYTWTDNQQELSPVPFVDVPRQFSDPRPITLIGDSIDPNSIRITDPSGLITFQPGQDYTISSFPDRVEINRVVGGRISNGQNVLIDFTRFPQAANTTTTTYFAFGGRYDIELSENASLGVFARFARQDQNIDSEGPGGFTPNSFTDIVYGLEYTYRDFLAGIEIENKDATISPFNSVRYYTAYGHRFTRDILLNLDASFTQIEYPDEDNHVDLLSASTSVQWRVTRDFSFFAVIAYRNEQNDQSGNTRGLEEQIEFNWRRRQTTVYGLLRNSNLDSDFQTNDFLFAELGIRREF